MPSVPTTPFGASRQGGGGGADPDTLDATLVRGLLHELRTPLNVLLGYADLLDDDSLAPALRQRVARVRGAGERLTQLLDVGADLARAAQHRTEPDAAGPAEALAAAAGAVAPEAAGRQVALEVVGAATPDAGAGTGTGGGGATAALPARARVVAAVLTYAVHRSTAGNRIVAAVEGDDVVVTTTIAIPAATGPPPPGQAGQRFWWEAAQLLAGSAGVGLRQEHPGQPPWRAVVSFPRRGAAGQGASA